jgi:hypothetical protein
VLGLVEKPLPVPASIADSVLKGHAGTMPTGAHAEPQIKG